MIITFPGSGQAHRKGDQFHELSACDSPTGYIDPPLRTLNDSRGPGSFHLRLRTSHLAPVVPVLPREILRPDPDVTIHRAASRTL